MDKRVKISFDYDSTLSEVHVRELARFLIAGGVDVWVLTSRKDDFIYDENGKIIGRSDYNKDIRKTMQSIGIPENNVIYTGGSFKAALYKKHGFDMHFDDDWNEVEEINKEGGKAFLVDMRMHDIKHVLDMQFNGHVHDCNNNANGKYRF